MPDHVGGGFSFKGVIARFMGRSAHRQQDQLASYIQMGQGQRAGHGARTQKLTSSLQRAEALETRKKEIQAKKREIGSLLTRQNQLATRIRSDRKQALRLTQKNVSFVRAEEGTPDRLYTGKQYKAEMKNPKSEKKAQWEQNGLEARYYTSAERETLDKSYKSRIKRNKQKLIQVQTQHSQAIEQLEALNSKPLEIKPAKKRASPRRQMHRQLTNPGMLARLPVSGAPDLAQKKTQVPDKAEQNLHQTIKSTPQYAGGVEAIWRSVARHQAELNRMLDEENPDENAIQAKLAQIELEQVSAIRLGKTEPLRRSVQANQVKLDQMLESGKASPQEISDLIQRIELENSSLWLLEGKDPDRKPERLHKVFQEPATDPLSVARDTIRNSLATKTEKLNILQRSLAGQQPDEADRKRLDDLEKLIGFDKERLAALDQGDNSSVDSDNRELPSLAEGQRTQQVELDDGDLDLVDLESVILDETDLEEDLIDEDWGFGLAEASFQLQLEQQLKDAKEVEQERIRTEMELDDLQLVHDEINDILSQPFDR